MDLSREELEAAKAYMRVDGDEDDAVVTQCVIAARDYMTTAGVALPPNGTTRRASYDICAHRMALDDYDERMGTAHERAEENPAFRRRLNQLKLTEPPVSNLDTGAGDGGEG